MNNQTMRLAVEAGFLNGDLELFPETIERFAELLRQDYLRELRALKPVGYMDNKGILFNKTTHPHLNTALYALGEPLAQSEQITTPILPDQYERFCGKCGACLGKPWQGLTDEQIQLMAHNDDKGDWSDLRFRSCWHNGYVDGVHAANDKLKELNT
jgi:hypothetical protein